MPAATNTGHPLKILVTGGAGFIGSALIRHALRQAGHAVVNVDCLTYAANLAALESVAAEPGYAFVRADVADRGAMDAVLVRHEPDAIMHLAAESHVDRSIEGPAPFIRTNVVGTCTMLEAARAYWERLPGERRNRFRFHHISTDEVFGDLGADGTPAAESAPYAPSSPYAASKAASDHLARAWHRTYGLPVLVTNCSNNYGPYQFPEKLIPHMVLRALHGRPLPVYGDGGQYRDWLHVEDHARALLAVVERGRVGETYNVGAHSVRRNLDVVGAICDLLDELAPGRRPRGVARYRDLIAFVADRPGHDRRYALDARRIAGELGWRPLESFESGLRKTVRWYLDNERWWSGVLRGDDVLERRGVVRGT